MTVIHDAREDPIFDTSIKVLPYLLTRDLMTAYKVAKHQGYEEGEYVFVGKPVGRFVRGAVRKMYVCGEGSSRPDFSEALRRARAANWEVIDGIPPMKTP